MHGDQISFHSIGGIYLSTEGNQVCTRRYCSGDERFVVEKRDTQYAFRTRSGHYLSMSDREPFVTLAPTAGETEVFQLFSLMMHGVNVGNQLDILERKGSVMVENLLADDELQVLQQALTEASSAEPSPSAPNHERRMAGLAGIEGFRNLANHPLVLQLARRMISSSVQLSDVESCRTDADHVRKELELTSWHVVYPYSAVEYPGIADPRISFTATWFLDDLDSVNSTWAWTKPALMEGSHSPALPQLSSPEEIAAAVRSATQLVAKRGSAWLYLGPVWMSNNIGAASFWKDYDAQTRYKHLSGQKEQGSFRALTEAQRSQQPKEELCPTLLHATYIREYVAPRSHYASTEASTNG